ncbi:MAG: hypothetical protein JNJ61_16575 [Anaerolineae bacterium]|nr:hypothetical protein [Anaerolineae bacterium]
MWDYEHQKRFSDERRRTLLRQAEHDRLAETVQSGKHSRITRLYRPALAKVGHWMITSGQFLQQRYSAELENLPVKRLKLSEQGSVE